MLAIVFLSLSLYAGDGYIATAKAGKITPKTIEAVYVKHGFKPSENRDMNEPYKIEFGETSFSIYNLYTYYHPEIAQKLLVKNPIAGVFVPQSMSIWQSKGEKEIHAAFLKASGMAKALGMDPNDPDLVALEKANMETLKEAMPGVKFEETKYTVNDSKGALITHFEKAIDDPSAAEDTLSEFQEFFEGGLEEKGFVVAGYNDFQVQEFDSAKIKDFAFYPAYSICMLKVIYNVAKKNPEAGMYAPCTVVNYSKAGSDKMTIAFPSVYNWITGLNITDKSALDVLTEAQKKMEGNIKDSL